MWTIGDQMWKCDHMGFIHLHHENVTKPQASRVSHILYVTLHLLPM